MKRRRGGEAWEDGVWPGAGGEPFLEDIVHILGKSETVLSLLADACCSKSKRDTRTEEGMEGGITKNGGAKKEKANDQIR